MQKATDMRLHSQATGKTHEFIDEICSGQQDSEPTFQEAASFLEGERRFYHLIDQYSLLTKSVVFCICCSATAFYEEDAFGPRKSAFPMESVAIVYG